MQVGREFSEENHLTNYNNNRYSRAMDSLPLERYYTTNKILKSSAKKNRRYS